MKAVLLCFNLSRALIHSCLFFTLVILANPPEVCIISRLWVIVSVYVFWRGLMRGWIECPSPHQVALPRLPAAPLSSGLSLAVAALSEIEMGSPPFIFCPSPENLCVWVDGLCVCAHASNCKHIRMHKHTQQLPTFHCVIKQRVTQRSRKRCCSLLISHILAQIYFLE